MFKSIASMLALAGVVVAASVSPAHASAGGPGYNTGITGGIKGINNHVPAPRHVPRPRNLPRRSDPYYYNTGITGGMKFPGINNRVPGATQHLAPKK